MEEVLPLVHYRHLIITIPVTLRKAFLFDRSLYGDLCRVAYSSTRSASHVAPHAAGYEQVGQGVSAIIRKPFPEHLHRLRRIDSQLHSATPQNLPPVGEAQGEHSHGELLTGHAEHQRLVGPSG